MHCARQDWRRCCRRLCPISAARFCQRLPMPGPQRSCFLQQSRPETRQLFKPGKVLSVLHIAFASYSARPDMPRPRMPSLSGAICLLARQRVRARGSAAWRLRSRAGRSQPVAGRQGQAAGYGAYRGCPLSHPRARSGGRTGNARPGAAPIYRG